jgi:hypothetical protein
MNIPVEFGVIPAALSTDQRLAFTVSLGGPAQAAADVDNGKNPRLKVESG